MRLVYVDEAGISNPEQEPFLVVVGVIVNADKDLLRLERHLDQLVNYYIPADKRDRFVFHAKELFNGASNGKVFDRDNPEWSIDKRIPIMKELAAIPQKFDLTIAFGYVERAKFPTTTTFPANASQREKTSIAHVVAYMSCALDVDHWMRTNADDEICLMVVEDNEDHRSRIRETQSYHQNPKIITSLDEKAKNYFPFTKIKEDPLFQTKRKSSPLQVADFCAYVLKRFLMNRDDTRFLPYFNQIRSRLSDSRGTSSS